MLRNATFKEPEFIFRNELIHDYQYLNLYQFFKYNCGSRIFTEQVTFLKN